MATGVGLRIAEDECTAAIVTDAGELQYVVRESILHMTEDGDTVLGGPAPDGAHSITGFVDAVGNPAGLSVDDGEAYRAEDLYATAVFCLINLTTEFLAGAAEFYATHPGGWPPEQVQSLREALDYLGLRSVVLIDEDDLPVTTTGADVDGAGRALAYEAAHGALEAVLSTPAGATPPDPSRAENATDKTDIIPALAATDLPQAYSQAMPAAATVVSAVAPPGAETVAETATESSAPPAPPASPDEANKRRLPMLVAAAVLFGLALGGFGVALLFRGENSPEPPPVRDALSDRSTVVPTPTAPLTIAEPSTREPEPTPEPIPTTEEPVTTTPEPTTTPETTSAPPTTTPTTTRRPSTTRPWFPAPPSWMPQDSGWTPPTYTVQIPTN